jgi:uncharacterized membrane protein
MSAISSQKRPIQIVLIVAGMMVGGFYGRYAVEQSEMFFASAIFFGAIGGLLGGIIAWALFHGDKS